LKKKLVINVLPDMGSISIIYQIMKLIIDVRELIVFLSVVYLFRTDQISMMCWMILDAQSAITIIKISNLLLTKTMPSN